MIKFKKSNWNISVTRNVSFFHSVLDVVADIDEVYLKKFNILARRTVFLNKKGKEGSIFDNVLDTQNYNKQIEKNCSSQKWINRLIKIYYKHGANLLAASKVLQKDFSKDSYFSFVEAYKHLTPGLYLTTAIGRRIHEEIYKNLKNLYQQKSISEIDLLIGNITYPNQHTPLFNSQLSILRLGKYIQQNRLKINQLENNKKFNSMIKKHLNMYQVIPVNFNEDPWFIKDIINQLKQVLHHDCAHQIDDLIKFHRQKLIKRKRLLRDIDNQEISIQAKALQIGTYLNEYRKNIFSRASLSLRYLYHHIAKDYGLEDWKLLLKLTPDEIGHLYYDNDDSVLEYTTNIWRGVIAANNNTRYYLLNESELKPFIREINKLYIKKNKVKSTRFLQGTIANPGKVLGSVKVIINKKDFSKFKQGDILVAPMTSVDFVPLMEVALAFVTNEGGITSHASIVSREMNKPCIIGTKIATQVLKDGDRVEVDANKGIVRILKK